jgi:hypothetical protein
MPHSSTAPTAVLRDALKEPWPILAAAVALIVLLLALFVH